MLKKRFHLMINFKFFTVDFELKNISKSLKEMFQIIRIQT